MKPRLATWRIASQLRGNGKPEHVSSLHTSAEGAIGSVIRLRLRSLLTYFA